MQTTDAVRKTVISLGLSYMLDSLGYSPQMINLRRRHYIVNDCTDKHISYYKYNSEFDPRTVGSKAEGVSRIDESDFDHLYIFKDVVCIEASILRYTERLSNLNSVYTMVPCLYHPGHYKLLLTKEGLSLPLTQILRSCLNPSDCGHWLSSKEILKWAQSVHFYVGNTTAGPAVCVSNVPGRYDKDCVITLPCVCPTILGNWIQRCRNYNWPPSEVIQQVSQMCGNLVATGIKGCHEEEIEWRLCFNEIEVLLVKNWNETETKLYIFLKMIKKDILKLKRHEITSYMMKNIVFWLSERYPQTEFRLNSLFFWVIKALQLLKRAVKKFHLPYYMIPERNLIAEKLPKYRKKAVIAEINNAIKLGPRLLWNCKKIEMAMKMSLPELQLYQQKIDELELLWLLGVEDYNWKRNYLGLTESDLKFTYIALGLRMFKLLRSPWPPVVQQQLSECLTSADKFKLLLQ